MDEYKLWSVEIRTDNGSISYHIDLKTSPETVEKTINKIRHVEYEKEDNPTKIPATQQAVWRNRGCNL